MITSTTNPKNVKKQTVAITLALLTAGLSACGKKPDSESATSTPPSITSWPATQDTDGGNFSVIIEPTHGDIARNQHFSLNISIPGDADSKGDPELIVDADMPAHRHGMNTQAETRKTGDGRYQADGMLFHMSGDWVITVDVSTGGNSERASFPVRID